MKKLRSYTLAILFFTPFAFVQADERPELDDITMDVVEHDHSSEIENEIELPDDADHEAREHENENEESHHDSKDDNHDSSLMIQKMIMMKVWTTRKMNLRKSMKNLRKVTKSPKKVMKSQKKTMKNLMILTIALTANRMGN